MSHVFTYGSLMCADIMTAVCGVKSSSQSAVLRDYCRYSVAGAETPGIVYRNVSDAALRRLDDFEGEYYQRKNIELGLEGGEVLHAQTYVFRPEFQYLLADWPWSFEHFLDCGKSRFNNNYLGFQKLVSGD